MAVPLLLLNDQLRRDSQKGEDDDSDNEQEFLGVPQKLRRYFRKVQEKELPIIAKLNAMTFEDIEFEEVTELVELLAPEAELSGRIPLSRLRYFVCSPLLEDPLNKEESDMLLSALMQEGTEEDLIYVSQQELLIALRSSPGAEEFVTTRKARYKRDGGDTGHLLSRTHMQQRLEEVTDRHDALITLPMTVIYTVLFVFLVQGHLRIHERQLMEKSMEEFVNGRDPRETADENVDDIDSWWDWVQGPGTRGPFGTTVPSNNNFTSCRLSSRNFLLGDVRIRYQKFDGSESKAWLLHSEPGFSARAEGMTYVDAARQAAEHFRNNGWLDEQIETLYLEFNTYNEVHRMFGMTEVMLPLRGSGDAHARINTDAVSMQAYPTYLLMVLDIAFCALVCYIALLETFSLLGAAKGGCGELWDYLEFWNLVDWFNLIMSGLIVYLWFRMMEKMEPAALTRILDMEFNLAKDVMQMSVEELEEVDQALKDLRLLYIGMHASMAILTASVVLKFFKAFQANLRLRVVTDTFKEALDDLFHFFITFSTIYLPFTLIGHIMFGSDLTQFASIIASLNTGFVCLMGDFVWYVEVTEGMIVLDKFPSGIPKLLVMLWFFTYMFLIFLVLLNMLLAIVMEHYLAVTEKHGKELERPTIWAQAKEYWKFKRGTKRHVSLEMILQGLEDDNNPAHPQEDVTAESLQTAWPDMTQEQVHWLINWLEDWLAARQQMEDNNQEKNLSLSEENHELALSNKEKIEKLATVVMKNKSRIDRILDAATGKTNGKNGATYSRVELDSVSTSMKELTTVISKVRRDQERLARRVEELNLSVPQEAKTAKNNLRPPSMATATKDAPPVEKVRSKREKKEKKIKSVSADKANLASSSQKVDKDFAAAKSEPPPVVAGKISSAAE